MDDSNLNFRINPDSDPEVCRIAPKTWIHHLVSVSHFADCRDTAGGDCVKSANKSITTHSCLPSPTHEYSLPPSRRTKTNRGMCVATLLWEYLRSPRELETRDAKLGVRARRPIIPTGRPLIRTCLFPAYFLASCISFLL